MVIVELTRFSVKPGHEEALLAARPGMLADFRVDRAGFIDGMLVRLPNGEWLDIVSWRSAEDFAASRAKGANLPRVAAFFDLIEQMLSSETGVSADGEQRS